MLLKNLPKKIGLNITTLRTYTERPEIKEFFTNTGDSKTRWDIKTYKIPKMIEKLPLGCQRNAKRFMRRAKSE